MCKDQLIVGQLGVCVCVYVCVGGAVSVHLCLCMCVVCMSQSNRGSHVEALETLKPWIGCQPENLSVADS